MGSGHAPAPTAYYPPVPHRYGGWPEDLAADWNASADSEEEEEEEHPPLRYTGAAARLQLIQRHVAFLLSFRRSSLPHATLWRKRAVVADFQMLRSWVSRTLLKHFPGIGWVLWRLSARPIGEPGVCSSWIRG